MDEGCEYLFGNGVLIMLFDLFLKIWATPENMIGLLGNVVMVIGMCLIFRVWKEKWWKCLIPFYGTYIIYKCVWKKRKWLFVVQLFFDMVHTICVSFTKKHIATNIVHTVKTYIKTEQIDIEISLATLLVCLILGFISMFITFLLTRITYLKVCGSLGIKSKLLKIGTFLFPQLFLLTDYIVAIRSGREVADRKI